jgi:hypothetical protein
MATNQRQKGPKQQTPHFFRRWKDAQWQKPPRKVSIRRFSPCKVQIPSPN